MKKLLLLLPLVLVMMFISGSLKAQECAITGAKVSADTSCIFTTWDEDLANFARENVISIKVNGINYSQNDTSTSGLTIRYSRIVNDSLANCDTAGSTDLFGSIIYAFFGISDTCEFQGGMALTTCPDNVLVSQGANCLIFGYSDDVFSAPPDSVTLNDTVYYSQGYDLNHPREIIYLNDTTMECDTTNMKTLLSDTLFFGSQVCTYEEGLLPIVILAFDYTSNDGRVELTWKVNSDEPTQRLYLQKSYDGIQWMNVHDQAMNQPGAGVVTTGSYTDLSIEHPKVYYRLFVEGYHGKSNFSNVLPVTMKDQVINTVFYQPQSRSIMIKAGQNFSGEMFLFNTRGQNVLKQNVALPQGGFVEVQLEGALPTGIYFVKFENSMIPPTKLFID